MIPSVRWEVLVVSVIAVVATSCYSYRIAPPGPAGIGGTEFEDERKVVWPLGWGLYQANPEVENCEGQPLAEVRASTNLWYALVTLLTLGFTAPQQFEWRCARAQPVSSTFPGNVNAHGPYR